MHQCYQLLLRLNSLNPTEKDTYVVKTITFLKHCRSKNEHQLVQETADYYLNILEKMLDPVQTEDF
jgi:hypothetical protein